MTYKLHLLQFNKAKGIVFSDILLEYGKIVNDLVYMIPYTKPFEKLWFYKDPEQRVQGPFSTIEMFNWSARGCFPLNLEISFGLNGYFVPMNEFNAPTSTPEAPQKSKSIPVIKKSPVTKERAKKATGMQLRDLLGIKETKKNAWFSDESLPDSLKRR